MFKRSDRDIERYILEHDLGEYRAQVQGEYALQTSTFNSSKVVNLPRLRGFEIDPDEQFGFEDIHYLRALEGGNVHEVRVDLLEYFCRGREISIATIDFHSESALISQIPEPLSKWASVVLRLLGSREKVFFNERKVSLRSLDSIGSGYEAALGETSYFCTSLTNDLYAKCLVELAQPNHVIEDFSRYYPATQNNDRNWRLLDYAQCKGISNHFGSAVLALSKDMIPIIQLQSNSAQQHAGKKHVSGAGSLEMNDLSYVLSKKSSATLNDFVKFGMARELLEETGYLNVSDPDMDLVYSFSQTHLILLTLARDIERGGLPIFLGFAQLDRSLANISAKPAGETQVVSDVDRVITSGNDMKKFLDSYCVGANSSNQLLLYKTLFQFERVRSRFECLPAISH